MQIPEKKGFGNSDIIVSFSYFRRSGWWRPSCIVQEPDAGSVVSGSDLDAFLETTSRDTRFSSLGKNYIITTKSTLMRKICNGSLRTEGILQ